MEFETVWPLNVQIGRSKLTLNLYFGIGINDEFRQVEFIPRAIFGATAIDSIKFFWMNPKIVCLAWNHGTIHHAIGFIDPNL